MSLVSDIIRSYRAPGEVVLKHVHFARDESRAIGVLMLACLVIFVSQWPMISREAHLYPSTPLGARMTGAAVAVLMLLPFILYAVGGLSRVVLSAFGIKCGYFGVRMALFWAVLAAGPIWLLRGLVGGMIGPGPGMTLVEITLIAVILWIWISGIASVVADSRVTNGGTSA